MPKNKGMTNSARFFNSKTNTFDVQACFDSEADSFNHVISNMKCIIAHPEKFTDEDVKFHAEQLADDFYTIIHLALQWENKKLKSL